MVGVEYMLLGVEPTAQRRALAFQSLAIVFHNNANRYYTDREVRTLIYLACHLVWRAEKFVEAYRP